MPHEVECTHCHVLMTTWAPAGSPVRYWQCPFCARTYSSLYSEVFARGAGARRVEAAPPAATAGVPQATPEEIRWARLKARAARWFARLEEEQVALPPAPRPLQPGPRPPGAARAAAKASPPPRPAAVVGAQASARRSTSGPGPTGDRNG